MRQHIQVPVIYPFYFQPALNESIHISIFSWLKLKRHFRRELQVFNRSKMLAYPVGLVIQGNEMAEKLLQVKIAALQSATDIFRRLPQ